MMFRMLRSCVFFTPLTLVIGCASLNVEEMVTDHGSLGVKHPQTVAVDTGGGSPGVRWFSGTIKPAAFEEAVQLSMDKTSLFALTDDSADADYVLDVNLTYAGSHPGFNMTAWVNVTWSLFERGATEPVWSQEINAEGRATVGEAFNGAKRQYMALERAAKENINQALATLAGLSLASP